MMATPHPREVSKDLGTHIARRIYTQGAHTREPGFYLLIGSRGSGKTSTITSSNRSAEVEGAADFNQIAVSDDLRVWTTEYGIVFELSGDAFNGELNEWKEHLTSVYDVMKRSVRHGLAAFLIGKLRLLGVILVQDLLVIKDTVDSPEYPRIARASRDRLHSVAEVFRSSFPVYMIFSKLDGVRYFGEFATRTLPEQRDELFGFFQKNHDAQGLDPRATSAETLVEQLSTAMDRLQDILSRLRSIHLLREHRRPARLAIYQFPHEFKRLRRPLMSFIADALTPASSLVGGYLAGVFFTARLYTYRVSSDIEDHHSRSSLLATDYAGEDLSRTGTRVVRSSDLGGFAGDSAESLKPMFTKELVPTILRDGAVRATVRATRVRTSAHVLPLCVAVLSISAFIVTGLAWWSNVEVAKRVETAVRQQQRTPGRSALNAVDTDVLRSLETLRVSLQELNSPPSLRQRWGLDVRPSVTPALTKLYAERLTDVLLAPLNEQILRELRDLTASGGQSQLFDDVYDRLRTHIALTSRRCSVPPMIVNAVLKREVVRSGMTSEAISLAHKQIEFYVSQLSVLQTNMLKEDVGLTQRAALYLATASSVDQIYRAVMTDMVQRKAPKRLADFLPGYAGTLTGPAEVPFAFTPEGAELFQSVVSKGALSEVLSPCVLQHGAVQPPLTRESGQLHDLQTMYFKNYTDFWRHYLSQVSIRFSDVADASRKLQMLAGSRSPLLGILSFVSRNTQFSKHVGSGSSAFARNAADLTQLFQPVHVVSSHSEGSFITDETIAYAAAAAQLSSSLQAMSASSNDSATYALALLSYERGLDAVRALSTRFAAHTDARVSEDVRHLLEMPFREARRFVTSPNEALQSRLNSSLAALCRTLSPFFAKYPFRTDARSEVSLAELGSALSPRGAIWSFVHTELGNVVFFNGKQWQSRPNATANIRPEFLTFLNRAQHITTAFFSGQQVVPPMPYALSVSGFPKGDCVELNIDGHWRTFTPAERTASQYQWPSGNEGVQVRLCDGSVRATYPGLWGIFRLLQSADRLGEGEREVRISAVKSAESATPLKPPLVLKLDSVSMDADIFTPHLLSGLGCPTKIL